MAKKVKKQRQFGLLAKESSHSFSKKYFTEKFTQNYFDNCDYANYDLQSISDFPALLAATNGLVGLNVTIPYKETIIPFLDKIDKKAQKIGAVNCITISKNKKTKGYNTDYYGFKKSLQSLLKKHHKRALILGTGGASKAVAFALRKLEIEYDFVSRTPNEFQFGYDELDATVFADYQIVINTTPLGTFPNMKECPLLPYELFTDQHIAFDLVYNPEQTYFLKQAKAQGAKIKNGYEMLVFQAEKAWKIWNK